MPAVPLLPSTLATIARSGLCGARSTAAASVHHGALPLQRCPGRATPEDVSVAGSASPLQPATPLLLSLSDTVAKSGFYGTGSIMLSYACLGPPLSTAAQVVTRVCPGAPPVWWLPDLGSTLPGPTLACLVGAGSTINAHWWLVFFSRLAAAVA
jgi:hypothetical protein